MNSNELASKILNFIVAQHKASESTPFKLGNVEFWHETPGLTDGGLCYSLPVQKWDSQAIQNDINRETASHVNDLLAFLGVEIDSLQTLYEVMNSAYKNKNNELINALYDKFYIPLIMAEGFNEDQAETISGEAYDRGHYAGILECVGITTGIVDFAKRILASA